LIVKEIINANGTLSYYAVMFKLRNAANADGGGKWIWRRSVQRDLQSTAPNLKEAGCTGCHASAFDFTRMNDSHP